MSQVTEARTVEVRAEDLRPDDTVVASSGAAWAVDALSTYHDRDGKLVVCATGLSGRGTRFSLSRKAHQPVHIRPRTVALHEYLADEVDRPVCYEAVCDHDGQTFNPSGEELTYSTGGVVHVEHYGYEDEDGWHECGRFGRLVGAWH